MSTPPIQPPNSPIINTAPQEEDLKSYTLYYQQAVEEKKRATDNLIQAHVKELETFFKTDEKKVDK